jgi:pimeloyl-ACP methyl ester carboxylesterase
MAYKEWGDADNPHVLVCVHGLTRISDDFSTLAQELAPHYRIVAPDIPGRGKSDWFPDPVLYAVPNYVTACVTLLARINAEKVDWLGTSMGGLVGICLSALKGSPIRKLIINDVGPNIEFEALKRLGTYVGKRVRFNSLDEACQFIKTISAPFGPHTDEQWMELTRNVMIEELGEFRPHYDPKIGAAFQAVTPEMTKTAEAAMWPAYDAIKAETLVIRGQESDLLTRETALAMTDRGPRAQLVEIEGVGHAPTFMNSEQINIVKNFLQK